jgi:hypothetical protein
VAIQQWDNLDALKAWYNGKDYQDALAIGKKYAPSADMRSKANKDGDQAHHAGGRIAAASLLSVWPST